MNGYIVIDGKKIKVSVGEDQFFITIQLRDGELGERTRETERYFLDNPEQLKRLLSGEKICL
jgi:hypothetical protein